MPICRRLAAKQMPRCSGSGLFRPLPVFSFSCFSIQLVSCFEAFFACRVIQSPELKEGIVERIERSAYRCYPWPGNGSELEQAARRIILAGLTGPFRPRSRQTKDGTWQPSGGEEESVGL